MRFGKAIKILRAARELSQKELAEKSGITPSFLSLLESEARTPSQKTVERVASALEVPTRLVVLLAAEARELAGLSEEEAQFVGRRLLEIILAIEPKDKTG